MASLSSSPTAMKEGEYVNRVELPPELTSSILNRLSAIEIVEKAQKVCRSWRRVCKDPFMWRKIDIGILRHRRDMSYEIFCRHAVDRSQGGLVEIDMWRFCTNSLLSYIADSSSNLRSLRIAMCKQISSKGLKEAVAKLSLLEDLDVSYCSLTGDSLKCVGQSCPNLKTLKNNCMGYELSLMGISDDIALAIAETMPGLCHLELSGDSLTNAGLNAILDSCPNLEHLDLRMCCHVNLGGDLEKQCSERIKVVRRPNESIQDNPSDATVNYVNSFDGDYPFDDYPFL